VVTHPTRIFLCPPGISVGPNSYGHPTGETLARLAAAGTTIWRTDQLGTLTVLSNGSTYTVTSTAGGLAYLVFLPAIFKLGPPASTATSTATETQVRPVDIPLARPPTQPAPPASLSIVALSGTTNPEDVTSTNNSGDVQDMAGWYLVSVVGPQIFNFPSGYTLAAGASVQVQSYSNAVSSPPSILQLSTGPIWNNNDDKAELRTTGGP
jgi:competence protein ComEC